MNRGVFISIGLLASLGVSWALMFLAPLKQFGSQEPEYLELVGSYYPGKRPGRANQGRELYRQLGCAACHTQQVQPEDVLPDVERGWGSRRSVVQDYLYERPAMLGQVRLGPDLADVGSRIISEDPEITRQNVQRQLVHLYNPRLVSPDSNMPGFPFLFEKRRSNGEPSADALSIEEGTHAPELGYEIVPKQEARALAAYLMSLRVNVSLKEAPIIE